MGNTSSSMTFRLLGKDESASKTITKVGDNAAKTHKNLDRLGSAFGGVAKGAAKLAAVGVGAGIAGLGAIAKVGFDEIKDAAGGIAQTNAVLTSTKGIAGVTAGEIDKLASSIQDYSGHTDDSIRANANLLLTFTGVRNAAGEGNDIFSRSVRVFEDMKQADPSASIKQLGKALNDPIKGISALTKVGVVFTDQQKKTIKSLVDSGRTMDAQKIILAELETEFGGSAKAFGESLPGGIERAKRSFENFAETATTALMPAITGVLGGASKLATKAAPAVTKAFKGLGKVISAFSDGVSTGSESGLGGFLTTVSKVGAEFGNVVRVLKGGSDAIAGEAQSGFTRFAASLRAGVLAVLPKVTAFVTGSLIPTLRTMAAFVSMNVLPVVQALADFFLRRILPVLIDVQRAIMTGLKSAFETIGRAIEDNRPQLEKLGRALKSIATVVMNVLGPVLRTVAPAAFRVLGTYIGVTIRVIGALVDAFVWVKNAGGAAVDWIRDRWNGLVDFVKKLPSRIGRAASGMWNGIQIAFKAALNTIIGWWNGLDFTLPKVHVPGTNIDVGGFTLGTPDLPMFAKGGVVPGPLGAPQLAVVHGGEEVLTPAQQRRAYGADVLGGGTLVIENTVVVDGEAVYKSVQKRSLRQGRRSVSNGLTPAAGAA